MKWQNAKEAEEQQKKLAHVGPAHSPWICAVSDSFLISVSRTHWHKVLVLVLQQAEWERQMDKGNLSFAYQESSDGSGETNTYCNAVTNFRSHPGGLKVTPVWHGLPEDFQLYLTYRMESRNKSDFRKYFWISGCVIAWNDCEFPYPVNSMTLLRSETQPAQLPNCRKTFIVLRYCFTHPWIFLKQQPS